MIRLGPTAKRQGGLRRVTLAFTVILLGLGIGWAWYKVFSPLFQDPRDWVQSERQYRKELKTILEAASGDQAPAPDLPPWPGRLSAHQRVLVACAEAQVARGVRLSSAYHPIAYPWGDPPAHLASSADLLVRCLRDVGLDLQQMIHMDRVAHPKRYPLHLWAQKRPDKSIDHRRIPNLYAFMKTHLQPLGVLADSATKRAAFLPGDVIFWSTGQGGGLPGLVGLVSDRRAPSGLPIVITLLPEDQEMTDRHLLTDWPLIAHFRLKPNELLERFLEDNPSASLAARPISP